MPWASISVNLVLDTPTSFSNCNCLGYLLVFSVSGSSFLLSAQFSRDTRENNPVPKE